MINPHPSLPEFDYIKPNSLSEASQFLAEHANEARPMMGGTDIFVRMRDGYWKDKYLVDVKGLEGMNQITFEPAKGLSIGASVNMNRVIASPEVKAFYGVLVKAARSVASYQLRNRATIIGNICNASPAGDVIGACLLLDGVLHIHGVGGVYQASLESFFLGPGETILKPGDIVTGIQFPIPKRGLVGTYIKLGRNKLSDLSTVGVTVVGYPDKNTASGYRMKLALASVAPVPLVVHQVETVLAAASITDEAFIEAAQAAMDACTPIDDVRASARYRKLMVKNLSLKALREVWEDIQQLDS